MNADGAAGFMMVWQEDPEGLRPGQGLGPGEGWSGAVVNQQTDLWYSYISVADFETVQTSDDDETPVSIYEYVGETMPKVAAPMSLPVRLTDNKMCKAINDEPYCYIDFENVDTDGNLIIPDDWATIARSTDSTLCTEVVQWINPGGVPLDLCKTKDGRVLQGRVGASRPRVNVQPYDSTDDDVDVYDSAWVIMGAEESKALGEGSIEEELEPEDIGKNMWYYTFDLLNPEVVMQGGMLNQPAVCGPQDEDCTEGEFFPMLEDELLEVEFYETEIARRFSHFSQPIHQIGESGVSAVLIVKQGILNQGGPADIFLRRTVVPEEYECETDGDPETTEYCLFDDQGEPVNPYAYENMFCEDAEGNSQWVYTDGSNPRYVQGLCLSNMTNVSSGTIVSCDNGSSGDDCAAAFPWDGQDDIGTDGFPKVTEWRQCDGTGAIEGCDGDNDLDDQSWENPYDVAKGHRGFIDGDFIMMMYAWSPNWKANSVGNDHYNLYARRSFDGGVTWTTAPADLGGVGEAGDESDPTVCENYKDGSEVTTVCFSSGPGEFEQSRNLSQLVGNRETILDPRYSPTAGIKMLPITDLKGIGFEGYEDDVRDPSKFFMVYETGDNTTVAEGEAVPLDLFYSRATIWGDDYDLVEYEKDTEIELGFDWLEHDRDDLSGEASNTANGAGTFYYAVWNQWQEEIGEDGHEEVHESDIMFRRIMYVDDEELDPIVRIIYVSSYFADDDDEVVLIGSARDGDHVDGLPHEDIAEVQWLLIGEDESVEIVGTERTLRLPPGNMHPGWKHFQFKASDKGGRWSPGADVYIYIAEEVSNVYLPLAVSSP
jgi:hypothetical protein